MPITYRQRLNTSTNSHASLHPSSTPSIQDTDSSIVLSDLLRSGESSRLRRRGAVRLDNVHRYEDPRALNSTSNLLDEEDNYLQLYCRECDTPAYQPVAEPSSQTPFRPSIFPFSSLPHPSPQCTEFKGKTRASGPQSLGRTLVHDRVMAQRLPHIDASLHVHPPSSFTYSPTAAQVIAFLTRAQHSSSANHLNEEELDVSGEDAENGVMVWTSVSEPVEGVVVPIHYEDDPSEATDTGLGHDTRFMSIDELARRRPGPISTACMCKREVVGCAVCGSPLGMRYTPCTSALRKIFPPPTHVPLSPIPPRTFVRPTSTSTARAPPVDPDAIRYRSRVADYLLAMTTPRATRSTPSAAPSPPDTIRLTPELHNEIEQGRRFGVSMLPSRVPSWDHRNSSAMSRDQDSSSSTRIRENNHDDENMPGEPQTLQTMAHELADSETDTDNDSDDSQNDDHYRLPMITQTGPESAHLSGHWTNEASTRYIYRFFAEAVIPEQCSKASTESSGEAGCTSLIDWRKFYASLYGLGRQHDHEGHASTGDAENRSPCG
ncbi:hypothetical protein F5879DRAFT_970474 [Lentinula edodes]|nr:hypothetical protein HHX47_DHR2000731 [Lentinula edodes]KAJ3900985.1 hypothetical protein F5879DRAFT_970474 [Lentinula edodes]